MAANNQSFKNLLVMMPNLLLLVGGLVVLVGLIDFSQSRHSQLTPTQILIDSSTLTERKLAIEQALASGSKTYTYTSNFTPGLGRVTNPAATEQQWLQTVQAQNPAFKDGAVISNAGSAKAN